MWWLKNVLMILLLLMIHLQNSEAQLSLLQYMFQRTNTILKNGIIADTPYYYSEYDFIVIGSGSGGSVVANRLSEEEDWSVLLLEAGEEENLLTDVPLTAALNQITRYNWGYRSDKVEDACLALEGGVCNWPKGRGFGGTSLLNFMIYTRGHRRDYDGWAAMGNYGWSYDEILPYFKKAENINIPSLMNSPYHGHGGNIDVESSSYETKLLSAFIATGKSWGYAENDPNGKSQLGFSKAQATIRNGKRCSAAKGYLNPITHRSNLHISSKSRVTKIIIDPNTKTAVAVEFMKAKKRYVIRARKEIILSAGTIASPQLLMLSGVGPRKHLEKFGIPVIQDLRVGYNLQDHPTLNGLTFLLNRSISIIEKELQLDPASAFEYVFQNGGKYTLPAGAEGIAFVRTNLSSFPSDYPDMELVMGTGALTGDTSGSLRKLLGMTDEFYNAVYRDYALQGRHAFSISPVLMRPKSRGRISLKSNNPFHWPHMQPNFFKNKDDMKVLLEGVKMTIALGESKSFAKYGSKLLPKPYPGCEKHKFRSDAYWECCIRLVSSSLQHQVGTCKMGPAQDREAVVNPELQVYGIRNLRVVDGSIIPEIPASHTNAPIFMIGEKASDMIKRYWKSQWK